MNISLRNLTLKCVRRIEQRSAGTNGDTIQDSLLQSYTTLDEPVVFVKSFFEKGTEAAEHLVAGEGRAYFLAISQRPC